MKIHVIPFNPNDDVNYQMKEINLDLIQSKPPTRTSLSKNPDFQLANNASLAHPSFACSPCVYLFHYLVYFHSLNLLFPGLFKPQALYFKKPPSFLSITLSPHSHYCSPFSLKHHPFICSLSLHNEERSCFRKRR